MQDLLTLRKTFPCEYLTNSELQNFFGSKGLHSRLSRMVAQGILVRIRKGLYLFADKYQNIEPNLFSLANLVFGPSYVSLESALSYYSLIPERTYQVTSICSKRKKVFSTEVAEFIYRAIPSKAFAIGVASRKDSRGSSFLIAIPEKALLDKLYLDAQHSISLEYLTESLRIDYHELVKLDLSLIQDIVIHYNSKIFTNRIQKLLKCIKDSANE